MGRRTLPEQEWSRQRAERNRDPDHVVYPEFAYLDGRIRELIIPTFGGKYAQSYGFRTFRVAELALSHSLGKLPEPELTYAFF